MNKDEVNKILERESDWLHEQYFSYRDLVEETPKNDSDYEFFRYSRESWLARYSECRRIIKLVNKEI